MRNHTVESRLWSFYFDSTTPARNTNPVISGGMMYAFVLQELTFRHICWHLRHHCFRLVSVLEFRVILT